MALFRPINTLGTGPTLSNPSAVTQQTSAGANLPYPTLVPTQPIGHGVGLPASATVVPWNLQFSDQSIAGALKVNPALAQDFFVGRTGVVPLPGIPGGQEPLEVKNKIFTQSLASENSPNFWKSRPAPKMSRPMLFGNGKPQKLFKYPWSKTFIPPLALFNDASQWVNRLMFNQPMPWFGWRSSIFPLRPAGLGAIYKPVNTQNLAAGTLNLQLQLGTIRIQAAQLSTSASAYYGQA